MPQAIITGATHGIGAAIARRLAREGFSLALCARNPEELNALQQQLLAAGSPEVQVYVADMADPLQVQAFATAVLAQFARVDILVNNVGIFEPGQICTEADGQLQRMMQVNVYSIYDLTRRIVPLMKQARKGHIFNICSVASLKAYPNGGSYSISKYALLGFSDNLREELKPDLVRVTAICPGATWSRSWSSSGLPEERLMPAEDVATMLWAAYSLSPQSDTELMVMRPIAGDL
jgi:short-subunit dehydrogenase